MRCNARIRRELVRHKGNSAKQYVRIHLITSHHWWTKYPDDPNWADTEACDGTVVATVEAEDEPYFGGRSAELRVQFKCDLCGNTDFPELPWNGATLSAWITARLDAPTPDELNVACAEVLYRARHALQYDKANLAWGVNGVREKLGLPPMMYAQVFEAMEAARAAVGDTGSNG